ncbi:heterokaryon incompatibility [Fusarium longipes]|uniref:Heterokaryon incompatibility n=1 Tax=Fusarium longipes TaxID=694270 RepID=A0A395TB00_9HYPO|nr:heterokaryon incompatibility [Fusarium longipes]
MTQTSYVLPGQPARRLGKETEAVHNEMHETILDRLRESGNKTLELFDNSVGQTRGWGEPLIFVPSNPEKVVPHDYALAEINSENTDYSTLTGAGDEYVADSMQLRSGHQLCVACKATFNYFCASQADPEKMNNNVLHSESLLSVFRSATTNRCYICHQLWGKIIKMYPNIVPDMYPDYRIECCWTTYRNANKETKMWMVMYNPSMRKLPIYNYQHVLRLGLWSKKYFGKYFIGNGDVPVADEGLSQTPNGHTNDNGNSKALALAWMARCLQNADGQHDICNHRDEDYLPTRLLDVEQALRSKVVRLVCLSKDEEVFKGTEYASLSHCWGTHGAKENPKLLTTNIESRQAEGLDWEDLPKTFQDAFKIASWLGLDWLWIDSMCIIQDSPSDWKAEASVMDKVYMNAKVNISADKGQDSRSGCFAQREDVDITPLHFEAIKLDKEWMVTTENSFGWMESGASLSRAWIHRERQLSRRILHFTDKEMVWECCGIGKACFASETMPFGSPFTRIFNGETKFQIQIADAIDTKLRRREQKDKLHRLWNATCQDLSNKSITYASDLPIILSSLAREFHSLFNDDEYACGLWRSTMAEALTWWIPGTKPDYEGYIAPSWSWLSAACPVELYHPGHQQHKRAVIDILYICRAYESRLDTGFGKHAVGTYMGVNGFLRKLHFYFTGPTADGIVLSVVEEDGHGNDLIRRIGGDWDENEGMTFRMTTDGCLNLQSREFECYGLFTTLDEWAPDRSQCRRRLACVLLEHESATHNGPHTYHQYKRIGTLDDISDFYSFKLRYRVASDARVPEAGVPRSEWDKNATDYAGPPPPETWFQKGHDATNDNVNQKEGGDPRQGGDISKENDQSSSDKQLVHGDKTKRGPLDDIWYLLTQYLSWVRWIAIRESRENEEPEPTIYSTSGESETDQSEWDEQESHQAHQPPGNSTVGERIKGNENAGLDQHNENSETKPVSHKTTGDSEKSSEDTDSMCEGNEIHSPSSTDLTATTERDAKDKEVDGGGSGKDDTKENEQEEKRKKNRQETLYLGSVILRIHDHASSGLEPISGAENQDEAWDRLQEVLWFETQTQPYGVNYREDPRAAMYQFDDVLETWQRTYGVVPWLEQLQVSEFRII